jgi:hypothetical protein
MYRYIHYKMPHINADGLMSETEMHNRVSVITNARWMENSKLRSQSSQYAFVKLKFVLKLMSANILLLIPPRTRLDFKRICWGVGLKGWFFYFILWNFLLNICLENQLFCLKNFAVTIGLVYTKARIVPYYLIMKANLFCFPHLTLHNLDKWQSVISVS